MSPMCSTRSVLSLSGSALDEWCSGLAVDLDVLLACCHLAAHFPCLGGQREIEELREGGREGGKDVFASNLIPP